MRFSNMHQRLFWSALLLAPSIILACQGSAFTSGTSTSVSTSSDGGTKTTEHDGSSDFIASDDDDAATILAYDAGVAAPKCAHTAVFGAPARVPGLPEGAIGVRLLPDEKTAFFNVSNQTPSKIYKVTRSNRLDAFGSPTLVDMSIAAGDIRPGSGTPSFTNATVSADESTLFVQSDYSYFAGTKSGNGYGVLKRLPNYAQDASVAALFSTPYLNEDGTILYGSSIFFHFGTAFVATASGTSVANSTTLDLGSKTRERSIIATSDDRTAFFASNRQNDAGSEFPGTSDYQIYTAARDSAGEAWGNIRAVTELKTTGTISNDPTWISRDGCRLYFQSDRNGSFNTYLAERAL